MAKDKPTRRSRRDKESVTDKYAKKLLNFLDKTTDEFDEVTLMNDTFNSVVNKHLSNMKSSSQGAIIDFIKANENQSKDHSKSFPGDENFMKTMTDNAANLYGSLSQKSRSTYAKYLDIEYVIKFNPSLRQAITMTTNHICCADEASETIVYKEIFDSTFSEQEQTQIRDAIKQVEEEFDLRKKIKRNYIGGAVEIGTAYAYVKPYKEIFEEYAQLQKEKKLKEGNRARGTKDGNNANPFTAMESFNVHPMMYPTSIAYEGISLLSTDGGKVPKDKDITEMLEGESLPDFLLCKSIIPEEVLVDAMALENLGGRDVLSIGTGSPKNRKRMSNNAYMDSVDVTVDKDGKTKSEYDKYTGVYIKTLEYKNILPVTVFGEKVCYLYIHSDKKKFKQEYSSANGINMLNNVGGYSANNKEKLFDNMVEGICGKICKDFGIEFLDKNIQFKKQIADCLIANGFTNNKYKIQVIPATDVIEFKINEDSEGNGRSLIDDSIVTGKMQASLTVSKLLNYLNKFGDRTLVNYTKNPMDRSGNNKLQQLIRNFQESDINLPDILSGELLFNKIGRNNRIAIPKDENGTRVLEFEQLEGQRVDLNSDYEEYLNKLALMGSNVPSAIMDYTDQLDFAKQVTTSNIKYAITISGLQADLEPSITELYRRILIHSGLNDNLVEKIKDGGFKIELTKPRAISNTNMFEAYGSAQQMAEQLAGTVFAINGINEDDPDIAKMKAQFQWKYISETVPYIDMDKWEEVAKDILMENSKIPKKEEESTV